MVVRWMNIAGECSKGAAAREQGRPAAKTLMAGVRRRRNNL